MANENNDLRYELFSNVMQQEITACLTTCSSGMVAGIAAAVEEAEKLGLRVFASVQDGMLVSEGESLLTIVGDPVQICFAEDKLVGLISKPSGVATAAHMAVKAAAGRAKIVCGSFKKIATADKRPLRHAVMHGGALPRVAELPFVYLDKNYIRIFGGIAPAVNEAKKLEGHKIVVQLKGNFGTVEDEARTAIVCGANVLMIDTGNEGDITVVSELLKSTGLRSQIEIAFAGDVKIADIDRLAEMDLDSICIGKDIIDARMMDLRLDVISSKRTSEGSVPLNLMEKSELWIEDIYLNGTNLNEMADAASSVLGIPREELLVVDVREDHITFDILSHIADASCIIGKEKQLMDAFAAIDGVTLGENAGVHSNGILGLIAVDPQESEEVIENIREIGRQLVDTVSRRVKVFPTGFELERSMIEDTNSPYIASELRKAGFEVDIGKPIPDRTEAIANAVTEAWDDGYGLVITSGGVGAEDKDHTVEGLMSLDPDAAVAWLVKFRKASGRHVKDGVRIACAESNGALAVCFPGPNDEVRLATAALLKAVEQKHDKYSVAQAVSEVLREKLMRTASLYGHM